MGATVIVVSGAKGGWLARVGDGPPNTLGVHEALARLVALNQGRYVIEDTDGEENVKA